MGTVWTAFSSMSFSGLTLVEASGTQVKNSGVDVVGRLADSHDMVGLRLTTLKIELHTNILRSDPASRNAVTQFITLGSSTTATHGAVATLLEESRHSDLLISRLQSSVDGVPIIPRRVELLQGAEMTSSNFQDKIPR